MIRCARCNSSQLPNTLFCDVCGEPIPDNLAEPYLEHRRALSMTLLERNQTLVLPRQVSLIFGRADRKTGQMPDVDLAPFGAAEAGVSRHHVRLVRRHYDLFLEDLGSTNGTFINGQRLPALQRVRIQSGDTVRLGLLSLSFHLESAEA